MKITKGEFFGHYPCCPKCGSATDYYQMVWDYTGDGEETEVNSQEKWHCENCGHDQMMIVHYSMDRYTLAEGEFDDLEPVSKEIPVDLKDPRTESYNVRRGYYRNTGRGSRR